MLVLELGKQMKHGFIPKIQPLLCLSMSSGALLVPTSPS